MILSQFHAHMRPLFAMAARPGVPCVLLFVLSILAVIGGSSATSIEDEYAALWSFRQSVGNADSTLLSQWRQGADACSTWPGVICMCSGLPKQYQNGCYRHTNPDVKHVLGLDLRPPAGGALQPLRATAFAGLSQLPALMFLELANNDFQSFVPKQLASLSALRYLGLANASLVGRVPEFLAASAPALEEVRLEFNRFQVRTVKDASSHVPIMRCMLEAISMLK